MSKIALLNFVGSTSKSLNLKMPLGTPELQSFIHIVACVNTEFFFIVE